MKGEFDGQKVGFSIDGCGDSSRLGCSGICPK
jgi:hypothetical protein